LEEFAMSEPEREETKEEVLAEIGQLAVQLDKLGVEHPALLLEDAKRHELNDQRTHFQRLLDEAEGTSSLELPQDDDIIDLDDLDEGPSDEPPSEKTEETPRGREPARNGGRRGKQDDSPRGRQIRRCKSLLALLPSGHTVRQQGFYNFDNMEEEELADKEEEFVRALTDVYDAICTKESADESTQKAHARIVELEEQVRQLQQKAGCEENILVYLAEVLRLDEENSGPDVIVEEVRQLQGDLTKAGDECREMRGRLDDVTHVLERVALDLGYSDDAWDDGGRFRVVEVTQELVGRYQQLHTEGSGASQEDDEETPPRPHHEDLVGSLREDDSPAAGDTGGEHIITTTAGRRRRRRSVWQYLVAVVLLLIAFWAGPKVLSSILSSGSITTSTQQEVEEKDEKDQQPVAQEDSDQGAKSKKEEQTGSSSDELKKRMEASLERLKALRKKPE